MPGVPSSRGCEACRKQRKKCDQANPACSRCTRLCIPCVGAGQQRYKFQAVSSSGRNSRSPTNLQVMQTAVSSRAKVSAPPTNAVDTLRACFLGAMTPATDIRFNLQMNYGAYLHEVPRHLGRSESLDAAAHAVICAHEDACLERSISTKTLANYLRAIKALRLSLDDPAKSQSPETLCAIMLLLTCQGLAGISEGIWSGHCEGVAQILRARGSYAPRDDLDRVAISSLRGPIVLESIFNNKLHFFSEELSQMMEIQYCENTDEGILFHCLSRMPMYMRRAKAVLWKAAHDPTLVPELKANHAEMFTDIDKIRKQVADIQRDLGDKSPHSLALVKVLPQIQRILCMCLCMGAISCCVLGAIDSEENNYPQDSSNLAAEIVRNSERHKELYPLGAGIHHFYITGAWIATNDEALRASLDVALTENCRRSNRDLPGLGLPTVELVWMAREIRLQNPPELE